MISIPVGIGQSEERRPFHYVEYLVGRDRERVVSICR